MYFIITLIALVAYELLYFALAKRLHIVDRPNERSSHHRVVLLGAGVIFILALVHYGLFNTDSGLLLHLGQHLLPGNGYMPFLGGALLLAVVSYADDLHPLPSWLRMLAQCAAIVLAFHPSIATLQVWQMMLLVIVFAGVLNVYNFMDGINGMLAAYSLAVVGTFFVINLFIHPFVDTQLLATMLLAILVFGFFNFRTHARCFSGDVGSIVMGFTVVYLLVRYDASLPDNGENVSFLCFIIVFLADGLLTIAKRFLSGRNILEAHREHLYETLVNELHVPHLRVAASYALLQLLVNVGYLTVTDKNLYTFVVAFLLVVAYGLFFNYCNRRGLTLPK